MAPVGQWNKWFPIHRLPKDCPYHSGIEAELKAVCAKMNLLFDAQDKTLEQATKDMDRRLEGRVPQTTGYAGWNIRYQAGIAGRGGKNGVEVDPAHSGWGDAGRVQPVV